MYIMTNENGRGRKAQELFSRPSRLKMGKAHSESLRLRTGHEYLGPKPRFDVLSPSYLYCIILTNLVLSYDLI